MVPPEERKKMRSYFQKRLKGNNVPETYEARHICKDGRHIWILSVSRLVEWKGEPALHIAFTDITSKRTSE